MHWEVLQHYVLDQLLFLLVELTCENLPADYLHACRGCDFEKMTLPAINAAVS